VRGPDPALTGRFRTDLEALTGGAPGPERRLALAVSGGGDSLALLLLAHAAWPGAVIAATVDHGLRPEAATEAAQVASICDALAVPHAVLRGDFPCEGNLQEQARRMRYALLADWAAPRAAWLATAHQQDDVAEGLLMRLRRGAGVGGLAEMRASRPMPGTLTLVRPLLGWRRDQLAAIVETAGLTPAEDPSNAHPRFDRSRIRALLSTTPELPPARLALAARNLRHAEDTLDWIAEREWQARSHIEDGVVSIDPAGLPYELRRRLTLRAVHHILGPSRWRGTGIDRLAAALDDGGTGTIAGVRARAIGGRWRFDLAPPRRSH
jgi:tRNA(Ile)-lysidine synthase